MDNYFSKLKSTVTTTLTSTINKTVSNLNQLSNFLPGNNVTREFEIINDYWTSGGNQLCWKIYNSVKKSTNQEASIFVLEKKSLDIYSRKDKELILECLRKSITQLTRLRHPSILKVEHPLEESIDSIAFATEPVFCSLANVLGFTENMSIPILNEVENHEFFDTEIQFGLFQIAKGVSFLHNDVKLLHRNICLESIIITKRGEWKLFGFEFCSQPMSLDEMPLNFPKLDLNNKIKDSSKILLPDFTFLAPEYYDENMNEENKKILLNSDMFSLGFLTFYLFNRKNEFYTLFKKPNHLDQNRIKALKELGQNYNKDLEKIPEESRFFIKNLLSVDPSLRPNISQFLKIGLFDNIQVKTLQYLDTIFQWDNLEKMKFYKDLPEILNYMPERIKVNKIMPELAKEFINPDMVPFVLPNYLLILKDMENEKEFLEFCLPQLNCVFQMKEPIQISIILMQNIELIVSKFKKNQESIKNYVLPMISRCFDQTNIEIQELCIDSVPKICDNIDQSNIKNCLLPKIKKLCSSSQNLSVKVKSFLCLSKIVLYLDKWLVIDEIISFLPEVKAKETACIMACVGIYQLCLNHEKLGLPKEVLCNKVIPHMLILSIENSLNVNQYEIIMSLIKIMIKKVEDEHKNKLAQMDLIKTQQSMALVSFNNSSSNDFSINSKNILSSLEKNPSNNQNDNKNNKNFDNSLLMPKTIQNFNEKVENKNENQKDFFKDLTYTLNKTLPNKEVTTKNKTLSDYSHLIDFNLKDSTKKQNKLTSFTNFNTNNSLKQNTLSDLKKQTINDIMSNQTFTLKANNEKEKYNKLNKSDLDDLLN